MSKTQKTLQASGCANVKSTSDINLFCLLHQELISRLSVISCLLMSYAHTKFHTHPGKLMREEGFSQGETEEVRDATAGQIKIWVKG